MPRYVAFLRGVYPTNANMADLRRSFEAARFTNVKTVLASGNVVFDARSRESTALAAAAEAAMSKVLGRSFATIVRPSKALQRLIEADPFARYELPSNAKRVVTFLREAPKVTPTLPLEKDGATILAMAECTVFTAYTPHANGPVFMTLIEKTFGKNVTTRTWDTIRKCAQA